MSDDKARLANRERQRKYREAHRDEINQQRKDRYQNRIAQGKCPRCGGKVRKGYTLCAECCEYQANLNRKYLGDRKKTERKKTELKKSTGKSVAAKKDPAKKPVKKSVVKAKPKAAVKAKSGVKTKTAAVKKKKTKK